MIKLYAQIMLLFLMSGCSSVIHTFKSTSDLISAKSLPEGRYTQTIDIINSQPRREYKKRVRSIFTPVYYVTAYRDAVKNYIDALSRELVKKGATIQPGAAKKMLIKIEKMYFTQTKASSAAYIDLKVELGENKKPIRFLCKKHENLFFKSRLPLMEFHEKKLNMCLSQLLDDVMNHPDFSNYLGIVKE